jgi:hypothetical protein
MFVDGYWLGIKDGDVAARDIFRRHYSWHEYKDGRAHNIFVGPGFKIVLVTQDYSALFIWRKFIDKSGQKGINCAVFRNESNFISSSLILEAEQIAWNRWPGERLYTYVNAKRVKSSNPGYCFQMAGWVKCGVSKSKGLIILEKIPQKGGEE